MVTWDLTPGPCPVCGTAHTACLGDDSGASLGVGTTRGVIVRQAPQRDAAGPRAVGEASVGPSEASPTPAPPPPVDPPAANRAERRRQAPQPNGRRT